MAPVRFEPGGSNRTGGFEPEPKVPVQNRFRNRKPEPGHPIPVPVFYFLEPEPPVQNRLGTETGGFAGSGSGSIF
ncbi:hypothetical protein ACOSP7_032906 [Xanthoceras sorbifolium]